MSAVTRRTHKKSRRGCACCKRRHVKCGEEKPSCQNCVNNKVRCSFLDTDPYVGQDSISTSTSALLTPTSIQTPSLSLTESEPVEVGSRSLSAPASIQEGQLNFTHLELLHHVLRRGTLWSTMGLNPDEEHDATNEVFRISMEYPYLMHELLSFSALHMSTTQRDRASFFRYQAMELQTTALAMFKTAMATQQGHSHATFLFSAFLGTYSLHDAISTDSDDLGAFLDNFVRYLKVARGVVTQITGEQWTGLQDGPLRGIYVASVSIPDPDDATAPELAALEELIRTADISPASLQIYQETLSLLRTAFQAYRTSRVGDSSVVISAIFTIPIRLSPGYTKLLEQRRPEALAILAHFGVLIYLHRHVWIFQGHEKALISVVTRYLGAYWEPWLALPLSMLREGDET